MKAKVQSVAKVAELVVDNCIRPQSNESMLILSDEQRKRIAQALYDSAVKVCNPILILSKKGIPQLGLQAIRDADIVVLLTAEKLELDPRVMKARKEGARVLSLPGIDEEVFRRAVAVDYDRLRRTTELFSKKLEGAKTVRVKTPAGTNLKFDIDRQPVLRFDGAASKIRKLVRLPDGEACLAPVQSSIDGVIMVDGSLGELGKVKDRIELHVKAGRAFIYSDNADSKNLAQLMDKYGPSATVVGKFGIGTNPSAKVVGSSEDAKALGTVNFGLGDNRLFAGTNSCGIQIDLVLLKPTITVDNRRLMVDGQLDYEDLFR